MKGEGETLTKGATRAEIQDEFVDDASLKSLEEILEEIFYETWVSSIAKKKEKKLGRGRAVVTTRTSNGAPKDGRTILEMVTQRAQARDDTSKGINDSNQFLSLNNLSNEYIHDIMDNLDIEIENVDTQIDVFREEERVRVALAEANYKFLASVNKRTAPLGEELQKYMMNVADNSVRDIEQDSQDKDFVGIY